MSMWATQIASAMTRRPDPEGLSASESARINVRVAIAASVARKLADSAARNNKIIAILQTAGELDRDALAVRLNTNPKRAARWCYALAQDGILTARRVGNRHFWSLTERSKPS